MLASWWGSDWECLLDLQDHVSELVTEPKTPERRLVQVSQATHIHTYIKSLGIPIFVRTFGFLCLLEVVVYFHTSFFTSLMSALWGTDREVYRVPLFASALNPWHPKDHKLLLSAQDQIIMRAKKKQQVYKLLLSSWEPIFEATSSCLILNCTSSCSNLDV